MGITREELAALIRSQAALLEAIATDAQSPEDAKAQYQHQHKELRRALSAEDLPCFCPWSNVYAWPGMVAARGGDWRGVLDQMLEPYAAILGDGPQPGWSIEVTDEYRHGFFAQLTDQQQAVLDDHSKKELAIFGLELLANRLKLEQINCPGRHAGNVIEYKVEAKASGQEIMLRVFLQTLPAHTLVLLWGYDKAANVAKPYQNAQRDKACRLRLNA